MPHEIELDPQESQESVEKHLHGEGHEHHLDWTRFIALSTALFAVIASVAALQAGALVNEALLEQGRAVESQAAASDLWAYFQAKGIKSNSSGQTADILGADAKNGKLAAKYQAESTRYKAEQKDLKAQAEEKEKDRDEKNHLAVKLMHQHHAFAYCVTFTQVAIALSAIAALTRRRPVWYVSMAVGSIGLYFLITGFLPH